MESKPTNSFKEQIDLLQEQVDQIQIKFLDEKKKKWYKSPSLILSVIAFGSSLFFSINSILESNEKEKKQSESAKITSIKEAVSALVNEEEKLMQITSNQYNDVASKNSAFMSFQAKTSYLLDKISNNLNESNIDKLEPNLLINYGRFLYNSGKYVKSKNAFEHAIKKSTDSLTIGVAYRSLANIFANPSYYNSDPTQSRKYRQMDIQIAESYNGETKSDYLSRSYELWALDEYYYLKNVNEGNRLIDSAKSYIQKFPDMNQSKTVILNRLNETYNFYNKILIPSKIAGEYNFYSSNKKQGRAYISTNSFGSSINIDFIKNGRLYGRLSGNGNIISLNDLKYEVRIELVDENNRSSYFGGTLNLSASKNLQLVGYLYEFGKKPVKYYLTKKN